MGLRGLGYSQDKNSKVATTNPSADDIEQGVEYDTEVGLKPDGGEKTRAPGDGIIYAEQELGGIIVPIATRGSTGSPRPGNAP